MKSSIFLPRTIWSYTSATPRQTEITYAQSSALGDDEKVIEVENIKIFACHGHKFSVKTTLAKLAARAKELGCAVALYGHTHRARADIIDGVTLINPGAGSRYGERSYLYLVVSGDKFTYKTVSIG